MRTLDELGKAVAEHHKKRKITQTYIAQVTGLHQETLSRLERGQLIEFGTRKLLRIINALGLEIEFTPVRQRGTLDELLEERLRSRLQ